ncbi:MAG: hypothetical protein L3J87_00270 [Thermoplasmata archaeon]|nr:hypothetical protein [Thermoplasmata archaeon]
MEGRRALVEVDHRTAPLARAAWNVPISGPAGAPVGIVTVRTWGTLVKGKAWLRRPSGPIDRRETVRGSG